MGCVSSGDAPSAIVLQGEGDGGGLEVSGEALARPPLPPLPAEPSRGGCWFELGVLAWDEPFPPAGPRGAADCFFMISFDSDLL